MLNLAKANPPLAQPLNPGHPFPQAAVVYTVREEMAMTIEDVLARRLGVQFYSWRDAIHAAPVVASLIGKELGWSDEQIRRASTEYVEKINRWFEYAGLAREAAPGSSAAGSN